MKTLQKIDLIFCYFSFLSCYYCLMLNLKLKQNVIARAKRAEIRTRNHFCVTNSGESRNFFLPVLRQKPRRAMVIVKKKKFVVADKKKQMSLKYPLIQSQNPNRLNYSQTLNFHELRNIR